LPSSYDNNLASWTMSDEYRLKKDRDRQYFAGQFIWSGFDYIGEPTPYSQFPVKTSSFGTIDTAGFPKDAYYAFQSQWTSAPMVHLVPMNWTDYKPGQDVEVWAYSNVRNVELFLNGHSLGTKSFDTKASTDGVRYLETTEPTGDDKNYPSGNYTSPNGSTGKLHLTWHVPAPQLPSSVTAVYADGSTAALPVNWHALPPALLGKPGTYPSPATSPAPPCRRAPTSPCTRWTPWSRTRRSPRSATPRSCRPWRRCATPTG
jgi:hypothetical protein